MIRYIPPFILHHYQKGQLKGSLEGFVLLFDIENFTKISTTLQKKGKAGAEELNRFLDDTFSKPIEIVRSYGGFVTLFAGDAFCAVFPNAEPDAILAAVYSIESFFKNEAVYKKGFDDYELNIRQTVVWGKIFWQIFENDIQNEYVFFGDVIKELADLASYKKSILFSKKAITKIGEPNFAEGEVGFIPQISEISTPYHPIHFSYSEEIKKRFIQNRLKTVVPENEIRLAAYCFANLEGIESQKLENAINKIEELALLFGGYINKLDASDKGLIAILLFGIPRSEGNTLGRICRFALDAIKFIPEIALGIASGSVFAGYTGSGDTREYTALGHPVNLAARLMSIARTGEILADTYLWQELHTEYEFDYLGAITLKGLELLIRYYQLKKRLQSKIAHQESRFVGREDELAYIQTCIKENLDRQQNGVLYISGDAGAGKSRLAKEALTPFQTGNYQIFHISCDPILQRPLEPLKQLIRAYFCYNPQLPEDAGIAMFKGLWMALSQGDAELMRIESVIASLLGYEWENSIWSVMPPEEKPLQLKYAFQRFMEKLVRNKPVILRLDDAQWLDEESRSWLQFLSEKKVAPLFILSPCRYQQDGNIIDLKLLNYKRFDVELSLLSEEISYELIASILRLQQVPAATYELINRRSMGNPLFIEQLTAYLMETGKIDARGKIKEKLGDISLFSISDIIGSRIDRLAESVRECVSMASVLGMKFNASALSRMVNQSLQDELSSGINNRIWRNLDELTFIFTHILIKDVVYNRMLTEKIELLHRLAGEALENVYANDIEEHAEEIALHYERGKSELKAAAYFCQAGTFYREKYDFKRAEKNLYKAKKSRETIFGIEHAETAFVMNEIASLYQSQGLLEEAENFYLQTLEIKGKILGEEHRETALTMNDLATLYQEMGKFEQAESLLNGAVSIIEKTAEKNDRHLATTLNNLALLYFYQEKDEQAEFYYQKALSINKEVLGENHPNTAMNMNNLALLYAAQGNFEKADLLYSQAITIIEEIYGKQHPDLATSLNNLALLRFHQQKYELAEPLYYRALVIFEKILGNEHLETITTMNNIGVLLFKKEEYEAAESYYLKTLHSRTKILGENHSETAVTLNNLALLYAKTGNKEKAESFFLKAFQVRSGILGKHHQDTQKVLNELIDFYEKTGDKEKSEQWRAKI